MRAFLIVALGAGLAGAEIPAVAAPPPPPTRTMSVVNRDAASVAAWVTQVNQAIAPANVAVAAAQPQLEAIWASAHDPASARAAAARARDLLRAQRSQIAAAQAQLAAVPAAPPDGAHIPGLDVTRVLTDARTLVAHLLDYNDALIKFTDAVESGDAGLVRAELPTIIRGSLLLVDGQAATARNRQAMFPASEPAHQIAGVTVALYSAMSIVQRASFRAALDHEPDQALADERAALVELATQIGADTRSGRQNLARVQSDLLGTLGHIPGADSAQLAAKMKLMADAEEKMFLVGDELESWSRTEAQENEAVHAQLGQSRALRRLAEMEQRLVSIQASAAAALAGGQ